MMPAPHYPGTVYVSEADGTTICASNHVGVASTAPDPLCKEHTRGGSIGGHYFAPDASIERQKANAQRIAMTWNSHDDLVESLLELGRMLVELPNGVGLLDDYDSHAMLRRCRDALLKAGVVL